MLPAQEFRMHAEECRRSAEATRSKEERQAWSEMADRWLACARLAEEEYAALERHRQAGPGHRHRHAHHDAGHSGSLN
jgi:hypothetical protein